MCWMGWRSFGKQAVLDLKACVGIESRVFVPEFSDQVINSPGEPGISYHMGLGFTTTDIPTEARLFLMVCVKPRKRGTVPWSNG